MVLIVVCGNIGAGKTTLLKEAERQGYRCFPEPVHEWEPILAQVYRDPKNPTFLMRLQSLIFAHYCRLTELLMTLDLTKTHVFVERCPAEALHVFLPLNQDIFEPKDYKALVRMHKRLVQLPVWTHYAKYVFLKAPIEVYRERIAKRNRAGESEVSVEYLERLESLQTENFRPKVTGIWVEIVNDARCTPTKMVKWCL